MSKFWKDRFNDFNPSTIALVCTLDALTIFWSEILLG
jgi:hypothetical protein